MLGRVRGVGGWEMGDGAGLMGMETEIWWVVCLAIGCSVEGNFLLFGGFGSRVLEG